MHTQPITLAQEKSALVINQAAAFVLISISVYLLLIYPAMAANSPMGNVLCAVADLVIEGNIGRGLATLAILIVGVGATLGKVSWGLAMTVAVGISVVFGAKDIAGALGIGGGCP